MSYILSRQILSAALLMQICQLRRTSRYHSLSYLLANECHVDHWHVWQTLGRDLLIFDDPYIPSMHLQKEALLIGVGCRVLHLPTHMSLYVAGKCQPRLIAPPKSKVDLAHLLALLDAAGFVGNFALTLGFLTSDANCEGQAWRQKWSKQIADQAYEYTP